MTSLKANSIRFLSLSSLAISAAMLLVGCGGTSDRPDLATVRGQVTLDGAPVDKAKVYFQPANGRPSFGVTDKNGDYQLDYLANVKGAVHGKHAVKISTYDIAENAQTGERVVTKELLPEIYHAKSTLQAEVKPGKNDISFDLKSLGNKPR